jgi:hypothetical protein
LNEEKLQTSEGGPDDKLEVETLRHFIENSDLDYMTAHPKICFAIIARIYRRVRMGYFFGGIKVSDEEMVVDGNHRYIAYKLANVEFEVVKATRSRCDEMKKFNEIEIDIEQDWDANHPINKKYCNDDFLKSENY